MNGMGLIASIVVGGIAGWLGGVIMKDDRYGLFGDIIVGIVGGLIGGFLFGQLGMASGGFFWQIIVATVGSVILLAILRKFRKR